MDDSGPPAADVEAPSSDVVGKLGGGEGRPPPEPVGRNRVVVADAGVGRYVWGGF
jgi:hypothetical protein